MTAGDAVVERGKSNGTGDAGDNCESDEVAGQWGFVRVLGQEPKHKRSKELADDEHLDNGDFGTRPPADEITDAEANGGTECREYKK